MVRHSIDCLAATVAPESLQPVLLAAIAALGEPVAAAPHPHS